MNKKVALIWFRNDLRLHDNEALYRASKEADVHLPVYVIDPSLFAATEWGFTKTGPFRAKFLLESLDDLREGLKEIGGDLIVRVGKPQEVLLNLAKAHGVQKVYTSKEVTAEERQTGKAVEKALFAFGIETHFIWQSTLFHLDDLPFAIPKLPDIFTEFRKACEKLSPVRDPYPDPEKLVLPDAMMAGEIPGMAELGLSLPPADSRSAFPFRGGESEALDRLEHYFWETDALSTYKETRNGLLGTAYSSKFSAWLSLGCISPRHIYKEVKQYEAERTKNQSTYWLVFELIWRDYFRFVARKFGNQLFHEEGLKKAPVFWKKDMISFKKWMEGQTGVPFIDANMRELAATGFMSNRGRQNVASFLTKDLKISWLWGAAWFEHCLLDYDPCSNYGNWAYVAGVGNDPREDRYFNILRQAKNYDPKGDYVRHWVDELKTISGFAINRPDQHAKVPAAYPKALVPLDKWQI